MKGKVCLRTFVVLFLTANVLSYVLPKESVDYVSAHCWWLWHVIFLPLIIALFQIAGDTERKDLHRGWAAFGGVFLSLLFVGLFVGFLLPEETLWAIFDSTSHLFSGYAFYRSQQP